LATETVPFLNVGDVTVFSKCFSYQSVEKIYFGMSPPATANILVYCSDDRILLGSVQ